MLRSCMSICGAPKHDDADETAPKRQAVGPTAGAGAAAAKPSGAASAAKGGKEPDFSGVWELSNSKNFDAYLEALGVSWPKRKVAKQLKPKQTWSKAGDTWRFNVQTPIGPKTEEFPIGVPVEDDVDGEKMTKTSQWEGGVLVTTVVPKSPQKPRNTMRRYLRGSGPSAKLILEMTVSTPKGDVTCEREFTLISSGHATMTKQLTRAIAPPPAAGGGKDDGAAVDFSGVWELSESKLFDEYLTAMGANWTKRKVAKQLKPKQTWSKANGTWQFNVQTPIGPKTEKFPIGMPVDDDVDGEKMIKTSFWEGDVLVTTVVPKDEAKALALGDMSMRRYITDFGTAKERLVLEMKVGDITCLRIFTRVGPRPAGSDAAAAAAAPVAKPSAPTKAGDVDFSGVWELSESKLFDEYLTAMGANWAKRKVAKGLKPKQTWSKVGGTWQFNVQTPIGPKTEKFPIGVPVDDDVDGEKMTKTSQWEGDVLVTTVVPKDAAKLTALGKMSMRRYIRGEGSAERLVLEMIVGNITCLRIFERVGPAAAARV